MSGNDALKMKKKDVKTSQKLSRSRFESPVVDPSRFIEIHRGVSLSLDW